MSFDIVIPLGPSEISRFNEQLQYTKKNVIGYRNIYIVTCNVNIQYDGCIMVDENIFPFKPFIAKFFLKYNGTSSRNGWYLQQLIKLYASVYIKDILDNYLVIDADVFFLKPTRFMENDKPLYAIGTEHWKPYFKHMSLLHNSFNKYCNNSGICHHMMFQKKYINEIFTLVEDVYKKPFWQPFILFIQQSPGHESGASEYEIYFNYMFKNHRDSITIRPLDWQNISESIFQNYKHQLNYDYVSVCSWMDK